MANITIQLDSPYITPQEYSRRTGMLLPTVRDYVKKGILPVKKRHSPLTRQVILINMAALTIEAIEDTEKAKLIPKSFLADS